MEKAFTKLNRGFIKVSGEMERAFFKDDLSTLKEYEQTEKKYAKNKGILLDARNVRVMKEDSQSYTLEAVDEKVRRLAKGLDHMRAGEEVFVSSLINRGAEQRITCEENDLSYFPNVSEAVETETRSIAEHKVSESDIHSHILEAAKFDVSMIPASIYHAPELYIPEKKTQREYEIVKKPTIQELAEEITRRIILRSYDCTLYIFQINPKRFTPLTGHLAQQLIGQQMRSLGHIVTPREIEEIKKMLLFDSRIAIKVKVPLPPHYWPFWDGLIDIQAGKYVENLEEYFYSDCFTCPYIPGAKCPLFDIFVASCTGADPYLEELVWETIGYILSGDTRAKKFFVFVGPKDTGKSLLANIISALLGYESVKAIGINEVARQFAISELIDKKLAVCMDLGDENINESAIGVIKAATGGDLIRAEAKYKAGKTTVIRARFLFGTNHRIRTKNPDLAFADRQIEIPFLYPVPKERQDKELFEKIQTEFPGIAVKAMKAYMRLVANNYVFPDISGIMPDVKVINHETVIGDFITQCCMLDTKERISTEELYQGYQRFTMERSLPAVEKGRFSDIFHRLQPDLTLKKIKFGEKSLQGYTGVRLKFQDEGN